MRSGDLEHMKHTMCNVQCTGCMHQGTRMLGHEYSTVSRVHTHLRVQAAPTLHAALGACPPGCPCAPGHALPWVLPLACMLLDMGCVRLQDTRSSVHAPPCRSTCSLAHVPRCAFGLLSLRRCMHAKDAHTHGYGMCLSWRCALLDMRSSACAPRCTPGCVLQGLDTCTPRWAL